LNSTISIDVKKGYIIVRVLCNITVENIDQFEEDLENATHEGKNFNVILDLEKADFLVSRALGIIVKKYKDCINHRGSLSYCSPGKTIKRIMDITKINRVLKEYETLEEAEEVFNK